MSGLFDKLNDDQAVSLADKIGDIFKTLPKLPQGVIDFIVKIVPYLALLGALANVIITPLGVLGTIFSIFTLNPIIMLSMVASTIIMIVSGILLFLAFKPLQEKAHRGWMLLFWSEILSAVTVIFTLFMGSGWISSLIGVVISFYLLYQIRPAYNPAIEVIAKTTKK